MGYRIVGDFEENAEVPTVLSSIQPATQPTGLSDFLLNETSSTNQSIMAGSDFPIVFSHEPKPSTLTKPTASTGRIVKAAGLSPLPSILQQGTNDVLDLLELFERRP